MSVESAEAPREQLDLSGGRCPECGGPHVRQRGTAHFDGCSKWDALNRAVRPVAQPLAPRSEPSGPWRVERRQASGQWDWHVVHRDTKRAFYAHHGPFLRESEAIAVRDALNWAAKWLAAHGVVVQPAPRCVCGDLESSHRNPSHACDAGRYTPLAPRSEPQEGSAEYFDGTLRDGPRPRRDDPNFFCERCQHGSGRHSEQCKNAPRSEPSEAAIEAAQMVEMQYDAHGNYDVDATTRAELRAAYAVDFGGAVDS